MIEALVVAALMLVRAHDWLRARRPRETRAQRDQLLTARRRAAWALSEADGIRPVRPGSPSPGRGVATQGGQGTASRQHGADPGAETPSGRHAARPAPVHPALLVVEQVELERAGFTFAKQHPTETIVIHGRQARRGEEIVH